MVACLYIYNHLLDMLKTPFIFNINFLSASFFLAFKMIFTILYTVMSFFYKIESREL